MPGRGDARASPETPAVSALPSRQRHTVAQETFQVSLSLVVGALSHLFEHLPPGPPVHCCMHGVVPDASSGLPTHEDYWRGVLPGQQPRDAYQAQCSCAGQSAAVASAAPKTVWPCLLLSPWSGCCPAARIARVQEPTGVRHPKEASQRQHEPVGAPAGMQRLP